MYPNGYLKKSTHWHPMNDFLKMIFFIIYIYIYILKTLVKHISFIPTILIILDKGSANFYFYFKENHFPNKP